MQVWQSLNGALSFKDGHTCIAGVDSGPGSLSIPCMYMYKGKKGKPNVHLTELW